MNWRDGELNTEPVAPEARMEPLDQRGLDTDFLKKEATHLTTTVGIKRKATVAAALTSQEEHRNVPHFAFLLFC